MFKFSSRYLMSALLIAATFGIIDISDALAQKKMTYQEAFAKCKQEMGGGGMGSEGLNTAARHSFAGGCMKRYGYRLKKSAKI
jgi:hypothetical protein